MPPLYAFEVAEVRLADLLVLYEGWPVPNLAHRTIVFAGRILSFLRD
jgi:hypothetical protein